VKWIRVEYSYIGYVEIRGVERIQGMEVIGK